MDVLLRFLRRKRERGPVRGAGERLDRVLSGRVQVRRRKIEHTRRSCISTVEGQTNTTVSAVVRIKPVVRAANFGRLFYETVRAPAAA